MMNAAKYSAVDFMRGGPPMEIRALKMDDRADLLGAVERTSEQSLYRRFFGAKWSFSEEEIEFFVTSTLSNTSPWSRRWNKGSDGHRRRRTLRHCAARNRGSRLPSC